MKYPSLRFVGGWYAFLGWLSVIATLITCVVLLPVAPLMIPVALVVGLAGAITLMASRDLINLAVDLESHVGYLAACKRQEMSPAMRKRTREMEADQPVFGDIPDSAIHDASEFGQ